MRGRWLRSPEVEYAVQTPMPESARKKRNDNGLPLGCLFAVVGALSILAVPAYQAIVWLQSGHWPPLTLATIIAFSGQTEFGRWLVKPDSWYGLHKIVKLLIFDVPLFCWLCALFYVIVQVSDD
jgi:hypothetical protein